MEETLSFRNSIIRIQNASKRRFISGWWKPFEYSILYSSKFKCFQHAMHTQRILLFCLHFSIRQADYNLDHIEWMLSTLASVQFSIAKQLAATYFFSLLLFHSSKELGINSLRHYEAVVVVNDHNSETPLKHKTRPSMKNHQRLMHTVCTLNGAFKIDAHLISRCCATASANANLRLLNAVYDFVNIFSNFIRCFLELLYIWMDIIMQTTQKKQNQSA